MKKLFPLDPRRTLVTHLFAPRSAAEAIAEARNAEADGAEAVAVEWKLMPEEFRNAETYRALIGSVPLPFMFLIYRNDMLGWSDEKHAEMLLDASRAGVGMIDVMGDLFSPAPDERTRDPGAIRRQKELIGELHALGSQVIVSSHPVRPMSAGEVLAQLLDFEERGADVVKIVTKADTEEEFLESLRATLRARKELKRAAFVHLCVGKFGRFQRMTGTSLGTAITFAVHRYHDFFCGDQPAIRAVRAVRENMHWNIADVNG